MAQDTTPTIEDDLRDAVDEDERAARLEEIRAAE
jgi:hypothetical protein